MLITPEILKAAPIEKDWRRRLPNETRIHCNADIGNNVEIGANACIGDNVVIGDNVTIGDESDDYVYVEDHTLISDSVYLKDNVQIGSWVRIGNNVLINDNAKIPHDVVIPDDVRIFIITLTYHAHFVGWRDGKPLFRLGCEIRPMSWFTSRRKGCKGNNCFNSGWARVWDRKEITEVEYRRYLQFFKNEAKRLGI